MSLERFALSDGKYTLAKELSKLRRFDGYMEAGEMERSVSHGERHL